jgi:hypothetical protein
LNDSASTAAADQSGTPAARDDDVAALAKGGRTNVFGFVLRLVARLPFLYFAGRWYGPEALGRFAYAILVVEFAAQIATLGLKRGLAEQLSMPGACPRTVLWDGLFVAALASAMAGALLLAIPWAMFPAGDISAVDRLLPLVIFAVAGTEIALAACAYRFNVAASVWSRAIVEPWTISLAAFAFAYVTIEDGLILSYITAVVAAFLTAMVPAIRSYGWPRGWRPRPVALLRVARRNAPLAAADAIEWGTRRLDLAILGLFASPAICGIYYIAQQVASLPQKLKTSFEPILGPVITRNLAEGRLDAIAAQVSQVGFWIIAAQIGVALALGIPGEAVMGLVGPEFVHGRARLSARGRGGRGDRRGQRGGAGLHRPAPQFADQCSDTDGAGAALCGPDHAGTFAANAADCLCSGGGDCADAGAWPDLGAQGAAAGAAAGCAGQQFALGADPPARSGDGGTRAISRMGRADYRRAVNPGHLWLVDLDTGVWARRSRTVSPSQGMMPPRSKIFWPIVFCPGLTLYQPMDAVHRCGLRKGVARRT